MSNVQCPMSNLRLFTHVVLLRSFYLFTLLGALFGASKATAQCSSWGIELTQAPATTQLICNTDDTPCHILYYYVYLTKNGGANDTSPTDFEFYKLSISGNLSVSVVDSGHAPISHLDAARTFFCSPSDINSLLANAPTMSVEESDNIFSYLVQNDSTEELITWSVTGRRLLFILAVNAFPGEIVLPVITAYPTLEWDNGSPTPCDLPIITDTAISKEVALPSGCSTSFRLKMSSPEDDSIPGYPQRKRITIYGTNLDSLNNITIKDLDFSIVVNSTTAMSQVYTEVKDTNFTVVTYQSPLTGDTARHYIYAKTPGLFVRRKSDVTLFYIYINGPYLNSECGITTLAFTPDRRASILGACCQPFASPVTNASPAQIPVTISWDGADNCLDCNGLTIHAHHSIDTVADVCHDLFFDLSLSATSDRYYQEGHFIVDITHSGTLTLDAGDTYAAPGIDGEVFTPTVLSPTVLRIAFDFVQDPTALQIAAPTPPATIFLRQIAHLAFNGDSVCISSVYFFDAKLLERDSSDFCVPINVVTDIEAGVNADDICLQSVSMKFDDYENSNNGVAKVQYVLSTVSPACTKSGEADVSGRASLCACPVASNIRQILTPSRNDNHINGVSTFDLVLISKHVLGIEPFTSPNQFIAADANQSSTVTTFDIVELRKLVLGIYTELPNNTSFRFVRQDYIFPNPLNPFSPAFPEKDSFFIGTSDADFFAIKIGDINGNAVLNNLLRIEDRQQNILPLGYGLSAGKRGQILEIPIFAKQASDVTSWQMALQYAPEALKIKGIRCTTAAQPNRYQSQDWNIPTPGELRLLWMDGTGAATHVEPNTPLCYIQVELLSDQADIALRIMPEAASIASESYTANGTPAIFSLLPVRDYQAPAIITPSSIDTKSMWTATVYPNPTQGQFRVEVTLPEGGASTITFFDALGRSCATQSYTFLPGLNVISSAQLPVLHAGQYMVRIDTPLGRQTIRMILLK